MTEEAITIPIELNEGQKTAYLKMAEFVNNSCDGTMFLLEGYAGTGKTFLISKLLEYIFKQHPFWNVAVTAPTNKAVKVLQRASLIKNSSRIQYSTIHKLLGLKEMITDTGLQLFQNDNFDQVDIKDYELVIVDEVSMLNDDLFLELDKYNKDVMIIFLGDPAQIPPVNKVDCIPFLPEERKKFKIEMSLLTEIMRQKIDNPIIEHSFIIRNDLNKHDHEIPRVTNLNEKGSGIVYFNTSEESGREAFLKELNDHFTSPMFSQSSDYAKLVAWRNKTISEMNVIIRKMIFKDKIDMSLGILPKIMVGEKLIANKPIIDDKKNILFTTNDEFEVVSYTGGHDSNNKCNYYLAKVSSSDITGRTGIAYIKILHEDSEEVFKLKADHLKKIAVKSKSKFEWKMYYNFLRTFADVGYNYAITAHKSQGSSYTNVFILEDDINRNPNIVERNRIKYTACTRPTDKLFIVKR
jgi:ATP-dependent exoDNAse (exonuclease V) alpha subunit